MIKNSIVETVDQEHERWIVNQREAAPYRLSLTQAAVQGSIFGRAVEITEGIAHRRRLRSLARRLKPI
jgi:hypothetical protein